MQNRDGREGWGEVSSRESLTATVAGRKDRPTQNDTIPDADVGSNELTCPTAGCPWGHRFELRLSVEDAGDCRAHPSRHVSARDTIQHVLLCLEFDDITGSRYTAGSSKTPPRIGSGLGRTYLTLSRRGRARKATHRSRSCSCRADPESPLARGSVAEVRRRRFWPERDVDFPVKCPRCLQRTRLLRSI